MRHVFLAILLLVSWTAHAAVTQVPPIPGGAGNFGTATNIVNVPLILLPGSPTNNAPQGKVLEAGVGIILTTNNSTNLVITATGEVTATNAQPPSANLTNWSTVTTNSALRVAKTVFVRTNGNDATGAREWIHLPFANPRFAKTNAQAGDTIWVGPGNYEANALLKNGVNYHFDDSVIYWTNTSTAAGTLLQGLGILDDRSVGAVTSTISGTAKFVYKMAPGPLTDYNTNVLGAIVTTNPATQLTISLNTIEAIFIDHNAFAAVHIADCQKVMFDANYIFDPWDDTTYYYENNPTDFVPTFTTAIYWKKGELHTKVKRIEVTGYCLYGQEQTVSASIINWWHESDFMSNTRGASAVGESQNAIYFASLSTNTWKNWIHAKEVRTDQTVLEHFGPGKTYLRGDKLGGNKVIRITQDGPGEVWVEAQKFAASNAWVEVSGDWDGTNYIKVQQYEHLGGSVAAPGFLFQIGGGTTFLQGGYAKSLTNGLFFTNGTLQVENMTIQTGGATNSWPVMIGKTGGTLKLKDVQLLVPSASTTTNAIYATNAQTVTCVGVVKANAFVNPNVAIAGFFTKDTFTGLSTGNPDSVLHVQGSTKVGDFHVDANNARIGRQFSMDAMVHELTGDDEVLDLTHSVFLLSSDNDTAASRTFTFNEFWPMNTGMVCKLVWIGTNKSELLDDTETTIGHIRLEGDWRPNEDDAIWLTFDGVDFIEIGRANNNEASDGPFINRDNGFGTNTTFNNITNIGNYNADGSVAISGSYAGHTYAGQHFIITNRVISGIHPLVYVGTNVTVDLSQGNHFYLLMTNNAKLHFTNAVPETTNAWSQTVLVDLRQDGTGSRLLYWDNRNIETNGTGLVLSTAANSKDKLYAVPDHTGTNFQCLLNIGFQK